MTNDKIANKVKLLAKYNYEGQNFLIAPEQFTSVIEADLFILIINQLQPSWNPNPKLFQYNKVKIEAKWLGNINYYRLKKAAKSLQSLQFNFNNDANKQYSYKSPFTEIEYDSGEITVTINPDLMPYFIRLSESGGFGGYLLNEALNLKSYRCKKLFRVFSLHLNMKKSIWRTNIDECMDILDSKSYGRRKTFFIENLINPYIKEIYETTSIDSILIYDKKTWAMEFHIKPKGYTKDEFVPLPMDEKQQRAYDRLIKWAVAPKYAMKIATELADEFWKWNHRNVEYINNGTIKNPGALVLTHFGLIKKADK